MFKKFKLIGLFLLITAFVSVPAFAARYENLTVGNLKVEKALEVAGLLQAVANTTGNVWYVNSTGGTNGGGSAGKTPSHPFATVDYAIGKCTDNHGDFIIVMPGHAESFTAADGFDADVAGITIIGLGSGADMPEFTFADTDATVAVGAANVTFENLRLIAGISDIVIGIAVEAGGDNFTLSNCEFPTPTTNSFEFLDVIDLASGADGVRVVGNKYRDGSASAANHFIEAGNGTNANLMIVGNDIQGRFAVSAIWSDAIDLGAYIADNVIVNTITGQHCIEFTTTATGMIVRNNLYGDTEGSILDSGSMFTADNNISVAIDLDGIPQWVIDNGLNHLTALDGATQKYPENAVNDSIIAKMLTKNDPAVMADYDNSTDSLQAIRDVIDTNNTADQVDLDAILADTAAIPWRVVAKTDGAVLTGNDNLFIISGGPIRARVVGLVTTVIGGASNGDLQLVTTDPAATVNLNAAPVAIDTDAAGTFYNNVGGTGVFTPSTALGIKIIDPVTVDETYYLLAPGTLHFRSSAAQSGVIAWYITYQALAPGVTVTAD
uniref:Uncharacterized protein n=1 Tax=viral metagenome TaxID=1070528 RepID=A0A6M3KUK4_9ZZZZ